MRGSLVASIAAAALVVSLSSCDGGGDDAGSAPASTSMPPEVTSMSATTTEDPVASTTSTLGAVTTVALAPVLGVVPFGSRSEFVSFTVVEADVDSRADALNAGEMVLSYELQLGFDPAGRTGTVETSPVTTDGQLAIEVSCKVEGCVSFSPVNDFIQTVIQLTVRRTDVELIAGLHEAVFQLRFDDGSIETFNIGLLADPGPSSAIADLVAESRGSPKQVQTVIGVGRFAYHAISAFESIWILDKVTGTVTRIDAESGELVASIPLNFSGGTLNRLAASSDAVYVAANPTIRIDPIVNEATPVSGDSISAAVISDGTTVWTASYQGSILRIDPVGTITTLDVPGQRWMDLAVSNGLIWALSQDRDNSHLIAFDGETGGLRHDLAVPTDGRGFPVRLVADETSIVVGLDTSGGGGRTGEVLIIDPESATITDTVPLASRPEGIVLTPDHIWTSGAVLDRTTSEVVHEDVFGFTITRGPDGSIWSTGSVPGAASGNFVAIRFAPGDFAG